MNPLIFTILCVFVAEVRSKNALLFNLKTRALNDVFPENGDKKCPSYLTACPASTPQEKQFNKNISLSKRSVFSRLIYAENESERNIILNFCKKSFEPVMLYNSKDDEYEIGYELYFEDGKINMTDKTYHNYKPVIRKKSKYEIKNQTISANATEFVIRYEDEENVKFNFTDRSRTLVFYWIEVLSIKCSKHRKRTKVDYWDNLRSFSFENLLDECANYGLNDDDVYSKENQKTCLKDISAPPALFEGNPDLSCGQPYGCLARSQIIPLWYFRSSSARLASCSHMNVIPVWKSIADGNLRRVDLYLVAAAQRMSGDVIFGVSGVLKMRTSTHSNLTRKMFLSDSKRNRVITIPRILYRVFRVSSRKEDYTDDYVAAIIIHNDPTADPVTDKLCGEADILSGWDKIINNDTKTGLTYVCPMSVELNNTLGAYDDITTREIEPLNLNAVAYYQSYTYPCEYADEAEDINSDFEDLLKRYPK